jgi:putative selenate reductase
MSDIMRPVKFEGLLARIYGEYKASRSIFDISENQFYRKADDRLIKVFGETCETPVGPAAGQDRLALAQYRLQPFDHRGQEDGGV